MTCAANANANPGVANESDFSLQSPDSGGCFTASVSVVLFKLTLVVVRVKMY